MRIRDIVPVRSPKVIAGMKTQRQKWARADVEIEVVPIGRGPFSMEFATEEVLAGPYVLQAVRQAENDGVDAVVLDCMVDPVLRAARDYAIYGEARSGASTIDMQLARMLSPSPSTLRGKLAQMLVAERIEKADAIDLDRPLEIVRA